MRSQVHPHDDWKGAAAAVVGEVQAFMGRANLSETVNAAVA